MKHTNSISLIGLGKLGLPLAQCFANTGIQVTGVDINKDLIKTLNQGNAPYYEPGLQSLITSNQGSFTATTSYKKAINNSDLTIILVATPTDQIGNFSNKYIISTLKSIGQELASSNKSYHQIVISSTVMPGSIRNELIPLLEKYSNRKIGVSIGLSYVPDFVAIGSVIKDFQHPDFVLIGTDDDRSLDVTKQVYRQLVGDNVIFKNMSLPAAEITKVALNNYLTTKISFANMLGNLCEIIPDCNVDDVTETIALDGRINGKYLKSGIAFGGTCFPRDTIALQSIFRANKLSPYLVEGVNQTNKFQHAHLISLITEHLSDISNPTIAILGLSFKPNTAVTEESTGVALIEDLTKHSIYTLKGYDPLTSIQDLPANLRKKITLFNSIVDAIKGVDMVVVVNDDSAYSSLPRLTLSTNAIVIDCWRLYQADNFKSQIKYFSLGRNV